MSERTIRSIYGAVLTVAGAALLFVSLFRGGLTWPVLLGGCVLIAYGGHIVSHSQMRELVASVGELIRAWRGKEEP